MKWTMAALAAIAALMLGADPPECPQPDRDARDTCRKLAVHAAHPHPSECERDHGEEGSAREACDAEAKKWAEGMHPAMWSCAGNVDCEIQEMAGRFRGYRVADLLAVGDCEGLGMGSYDGGSVIQHGIGAAALVEVLQLECSRIVDALRNLPNDG